MAAKANLPSAADIDLAPFLKRALEETRRLSDALAAFAPQMSAWSRLLADCWAAGGKVLVCGNGGSCADAMHLAEELVVRFQHDRRALPAIALSDPTVLTCCGNDLGYDEIFARQVEALGNAGDVLIVLTTSGNSTNILRALDVARDKGLKTVALLGKTGGAAKGRCDVEIIIPVETAHRVQEGHKILFHVLCEWADAAYA